MSKTYEEKVKAAQNFQPGTDVLVEEETVKDPKDNPFKKVRNNSLIKIYKLKYFFLILG